MRHLLPYKYIEEIARAGSIRKAAETLAITPSALNRRLLAIEDELGVAIFERLAVGVRLNTAGEILLEHIRHQLSDLERVKSQIADLSGQRRGHVSIACSPELTGGFLPSQVQDYQHQFPGVTFKINRRFRKDIDLALSEHYSDVAFVFEPAKLTDFQTVYNLRQPIHCVMKHNHPLAQKKSVRLYECAEFPLLLPDVSWGIRHLLDQSASRLGLNLRPVVQSDAREFLRDYKREGGHLAFEIPINLNRDFEPGGLVSVPIDPLDVPEGFIFVGHLKGRTLPVAAARFIEQVTTKMVSLLDDLPDQ
ncbi:MAG: LysR family transcriptional regulator [Pseudomonadota bacterium]